MGRNQELLERRAAFVTPGLPRVTTATADSAVNGTITDAEGNELIDFVGGIGVMNVGHGQRAVIDAIKEQAEKLVHSCIHVTTYEPYVALCEKLAELFPHGDHGTKSLLVNSGAEAVENAIKIARQVTGRPGVICFTDSFHGRTLLGMSLTSKVGYKMGCGPFAPEIYRFKFPNYYRYGNGFSEQEFVSRKLALFRESMSNVVAASQVAAVLIEPVQGEGGFVPTPTGYLAGLREICDEHGIMLILDEVQSGFCRTGKWAAYEHYEVTPDLSTWAKSMGGGMPIGCVIGKAEVMDKVLPGTVGGTYTGNPVACAAALATIDVMEKENLNERAVQIGRRVTERFQQMQEKSQLVGNVRGLGAMVGMELVTDRTTREPATDAVRDILGKCVERGLLIIASGTYANVIRVLSPLTISDEQLERGLTILEEELLAYNAN